MIEFITSLYNEEAEIYDLVTTVYNYVDRLVLVDDGSKDHTGDIISFFPKEKISYVPIEHTGLCELGRIEALKHVNPGSWVLMLDADERPVEGVLGALQGFLEEQPDNVTHVWFKQSEYIDGKYMKAFAKVKVFRKEAVRLPEIIHGDPQFTGDSVSPGWEIIHRKTSYKQFTRETEYIETYRKLLAEGKIDQDRKNWFEGMHYFVRDTIPHG